MDEWIEVLLSVYQALGLVKTQKMVEFVTRGIESSLCRMFRKGAVCSAAELPWSGSRTAVVGSFVMIPNDVGEKKQKSREGGSVWLVFGICNYIVVAAVVVALILLTGSGTCVDY